MSESHDGRAAARDELAAIRRERDAAAGPRKRITARAADVAEICLLTRPVGALAIEVSRAADVSAETAAARRGA